MSADEERLQTPKTVKAFARAAGTHLPMRLAQLRRLGKLARTAARAKGGK